jgi:hypothetical protein
MEVLNDMQNNNEFEINTLKKDINEIKNVDLTKNKNNKV